MTDSPQDGLQAARQVVAAARQALACGHGGLAWPLLQAWPAWTLHAGEDTRAQWRRLGLRWHAQALRRCIDGSTWAAVEATLPRRVIDAALAQARADDPSVGAVQLPRAEAIAEQLESAGRDVAVTTLTSPDLRAAVAAATGACALALDTATAQQWHQWAGQLAEEPAT